MAHTVARRRALAALAATPLAGLLAAGAAPADTGRGGGRRIPRGYADVDPRTARRIPLWHELSAANPIFPGDPTFESEIFTTVAESGYLLEKITSLGTHTGTHISAPAHFVEGADYLSELDESFTLMPLAVLDVRRRVESTGGAFTLGVAELRAFERKHGRIPEGGCVLLYTGFSSVYPTAAATIAKKVAEQKKTGEHWGHHGAGAHAHGRIKDYFDPAPGFTGDAAAWLFDERGIKALGSDTFGPDASSDTDYSATYTALSKGGITLENAGPGLGRMRAFGDWVSINGARPKFSGFQMGVTGFTRG